MKRIEYLSPVEAMRGNLSGRQDLVYNPDNNKAWYAPINTRSYALNYQPRIIGAKVQRNSLTYYSVKTSSSTRNSDALRLAQAITAGARLIAIQMSRNLTFIATLRAMYNWYTQAGGTRTFLGWLSSQLRYMLTEKVATATITNPGGSVSVDNPWVKRATTNVMIDPAMCCKFFEQLSDNYIKYYVNGEVGYCHTGQNFRGIALSSFNVFGIVDSSEMDDPVVLADGRIIKYNGQQVVMVDNVISDGIYTA